MKKKLLTMAAAFTMILSSLTAHAEIQVHLDGKNLNFDVPPIVMNDRTMVPFRAIFAAMGADVVWYGEEKVVCAQLNDTEIFMQIGQPFIIVNDEVTLLDTPPVVVNDRTLIPLRAVSEAFKMEVQWDGSTNTVIINSNGQPSYSPVPTFETEQPVYTPQPIATPTPTANPSDDNEKSFELQVLDLVNKYRTEAGLKPLVWDDDLAEVARMHSEDMASRNFFDHENPDGESPFDRMRKHGINYMAAAENIAAGQTTPESVMNSWMNSPGHYANIMNGNLGKLGVGIARGGSYRIYWTQCFTD